LEKSPLMTESPFLKLLDQLYDLNPERSNAHKRLKPLLHWLKNYPHLIRLGTINDDLIMSYKVKDLCMILSKEGVDIKAIERGFKHLRPYRPFCIQTTVSGSNNDWKVWRFQPNDTPLRRKVLPGRWGLIKTKTKAAKRGKRPREVKEGDIIALPEVFDIPETEPKRFCPLILHLELN